MDNFYNIKITDNSFIDVSTAVSRTLCYRMTYKDLKSGKYESEIKNRFIVYILHAKNYDGKDYLYIGKSKNGISDRPKAHENKDIEWDMCYILTQIKERTILNDGTIQYLEDIITDQAKETNCYNILTQQTTKGTANEMDKINCQMVLVDAVEMLYVLGLDLKTIRNIKNIENKDLKPTNLDINLNRPLWCMHAIDESIFLNNNQLAMGWNKIGDLTNIPNDKEIFKNTYSKIEPSATPSSVASCAGMLRKFRYDMQINDFVVFSFADNIHIGIVTSEYKFVSNEEFPHRRDVKWIKHIPRNIFSKDARFEVRSGLTLFEIKRTINEFLSMIDKNTINIENKLENEIKPNNKKFIRSKSSTFEMLNIPIGSELVSTIDPTVKVKTVDNKNTIEYNGEYTTLSNACWYIDGQRYFSNGNRVTYQGFGHFTYKGKLLTDIRKELEGK